MLASWQLVLRVEIVEGVSDLCVPLGMAEITGGRKGRVASRQQIPGARRRTVSSSCAYFM